MEERVAFYFSTRSSEIIQSFEIYVTDPLVEYNFECTVQCRDDGDWVIVNIIEGRVYIPTSTISKSVFVIRIPVSKIDSRKHKRWKVETSLPAWKVNTYVTATGYTLL